MGTFYTANNELKDYLIENNLTFHSREDGIVNYYTHTSGKQIKINTKNNFITFLDKKGNLIDESSSFTNNQINSFLQN